MSNLPPKLQEIVDDFASMSREEKIETLVAYSESLPSIPERLKDRRDKMDEVPECMTPVTLLGEKQPDGGITFYFEIPPQSPTVRGLASLLASGLNGLKPEEILSVPGDFFLPMNLQEAISQQRLNGFIGVLAHMNRPPSNYWKTDPKILLVTQAVALLAGGSCTAARTCDTSRQFPMNQD